MGDMADYYIELGLNAGEGFAPSHQRRYPRYRPEEGTVQPRCARCGSYNVRWRQQGGRWVLFSLTPGVEHRCEVKPLGALPEDDE